MIPGKYLRFLFPTDLRILFSKSYISTSKWLWILASSLHSTAIALFQDLFIFNLNYTTFGLVSLFLFSSVFNPIIHSCAGIRLLYYGISSAKCHPVIFNCFPFKNPCFLLQHSRFSLIWSPLAPAMHFHFLTLLCSCSAHYHTQVLPFASVLFPLVSWGREDPWYLRASMLELDTLLLNVEFPLNDAELPFSY